ncbi:Hsp70 family protein [Glycomyces sp. L485]|uniref:Hsp70 family protein n=1 Tax=Glycomyces sp. L485 TaxID=2909235 RepID=UPI001F4B09A0|nr:Hsp70 family protein [Glycomyces sp. L485]MCH7229406.1 Hsp70 family protein [Glycomyces sp. L485]
MDSPSSSGPIALGVDFGTSHTVAVHGRGGRTRPLLFDGSPLLPSAVFAEEDGRLVTGRDALRAGVLRPECLEPNPKRRIADEYTLLGRREYTVVDLFSAVLARVREEALQVVGRLDQVALTVPATWGPARRQLLIDAAGAAGLRVTAVETEPVAAAAYFTTALEHAVPTGSAVVIHDFGAGTFDASVVQRSPRGFDVLAVDGLDDLGGLDLDAALVEYLGRQMSEKEDWPRLVDPTTSSDRRHRRTLYEEVRVAKEQLSRQQRADLLVPLLDTNAHLTRGELEQVVGPLLARAVKVTGGAIREARLTPERTAGVFLVGGASRMPLVATMLHRELGTPPTVLEQPELVVAEGCLLIAGEPPPPAVSPVSPPTAVTQRLPPAPTPTPPSGPAPRHRRALTALATVALVLGMVAAAYVWWPDGERPGEEPPGQANTMDEWASRFVSTGTDGTLRTWNLEGEAVGDPIPAHDGYVFAAAFAELDGSGVLVSSGQDHTIRIWDLDEPAEPRTIEEAHTDSIGSIAVFDLDGRPVIVSAGNDDLARVWDLASGEPVSKFEGHTADVRSIAVSELDGRPVVVTGGNDGFMRVWDPNTGDEAARAVDTDSTIRGMTTGVLEGNQVVISADDDAALLVRDLASGEVVGDPLTGHTARVRVIELVETDEGLLAVSSGDDGSVRVWDLEDGIERKVFNDHSDPVYALEIDTRGDAPLILTGDRNGRIVVRDLNGDDKLIDIDAGQGWVQAIALPRPHPL